MRTNNYIQFLTIALWMIMSFSSIADIASLNRQQESESEKDTVKHHAAEVCGREIKRKMPQFIILEDHCDEEMRKRYSNMVYMREHNLLEKTEWNARPLGERDYCSYNPKVIDSIKTGYKLVFHVEGTKDSLKSGPAIMKNIYNINCFVDSSGDNPNIEEDGKCFFNCN